MKRLLVITLAGLFLTAGVVPAFGAAGFIPPFSRQQTDLGNGAAYISGGVGINERDQMDNMAGDYNLKLVFDVKSGSYPGAYLSSIPVKIQDSGGRTWISATSDGPWFFAKLPAGNYKVIATYDGREQGQDINVGQGMKTVILSWNGVGPQ